MTDLPLAKHQFDRVQVARAIYFNEPEALMLAFVWQHAPQEAVFWALETESLINGRGLSKQALDYLLSLLDTVSPTKIPFFFLREKVVAALAGEPRALAGAFSFELTPQGPMYWSRELKALQEERPLQSSSVKYLESLLVPPAPAQQPKNSIRTWLTNFFARLRRANTR